MSSVKGIQLCQDNHGNDKAEEPLEVSCVQPFFLGDLDGSGSRLIKSNLDIEILDAAHSADLASTVLVNLGPLLRFIHDLISVANEIDFNVTSVPAALLDEEAAAESAWVKCQSLFAFYGLLFHLSTGNAYRC